jgi:thymidylate synthase
VRQKIANLTPDELILTLGDAHIYHDHFDAVKEQLSRTPYPLPTLWLNENIRSLEDLNVKNLQKPEDVTNLVKLENYQFHPTIKAKMAV